jgi:CHAD domain-containing protein
MAGTGKTGSRLKNWLAAQLDQIHRNSAKVLRGVAVEPLHDLRVAALRVSFALKFFNKYLSGGNANRLRHEFAHARHVMAQRRDWDIFSSRVKKDFQVINTSPSLKQKILAIIKVQEAKAHRDLGHMIRSSRYKRMLRDLKQIAPSGNKRKFKPQHLFKDLLKTVKHKQAALKPSELHKIRITFKHLRYACELLADFYDKKKIHKVIHDIIKIQDLLGEHQDAETAVRMLNHLKITGHRKEIAKFIGMERNSTLEARNKFVKMLNCSIEAFDIFRG